MTKQEAKDLFRDCKSDFIIEKLYQYFTERSCDSCKGCKYYNEPLEDFPFCTLYEKDLSFSCARLKINDNYTEN